MTLSITPVRYNVNVRLGSSRSSAKTMIEIQMNKIARKTDGYFMAYIITHERAQD
jgi:hypothetical protein